jgi:EmrB/QacA subfamily drug resistance transporter
MDRRWLILSAVSVGTFMATLDGSIVNISLPSIQAAFGIELTVVEWVSIAYLVVVGSVLLPFGRLGEVLTFRRVYLTGFVVFTVASVLCGAAPGPGALIGFRVIQGVGAGMLQAMGPAIVARTFGPGERGRALGLNAISVSLGLTLGPVLGGVLTELATWRAVFLVNLPIGLFAIVWAMHVLPREHPTGGQTFDVPGAGLSGTALLTLLLALTQGESLGWTSPVIVVLLATFVLTAALFLWAELRATQPMIDLRLFTIRAFSAGNASVVIAFAGLFTATFLLPFLLERGAGYTPIEAGLLLTPVPVVGALVAPCQTGSGRGCRPASGSR